MIECPEFDTPVEDAGLVMTKGFSMFEGFIALMVKFINLDLMRKG